MSDRLEEIIFKLDMENIKLKDQLEKAERVINFYQDPRIYEVQEGLTTIDPCDHELIVNKWGDQNWLGGKRARNYFKGEL